MKRALLIGINYINMGDAYIEGCIDDIISMKQYLIQSMDYKEDEIIMLRDDSSDPALQPTGNNIKTQLMNLLHDSQSLQDLVSLFRTWKSSY